MNPSDTNKPSTPTTPTTNTTVSHFQSSKCVHDGKKGVIIGGFEVRLGGQYDLAGEECIDQVHAIVTLNGNIASKTFFGQRLTIIEAALPDRGGVPDSWQKFIEYMASEIRNGLKIAAHCTAGHGRTGTFAASLIAIMEPEVEDPIAAIRERHCKKAVESEAQAIAIFKLKGLELPQKYKDEFTPKITVYSGGSSWSGSHMSSNYKKEICMEDLFEHGDMTTKEPFDAWWKRRKQVLIFKWKQKMQDVNLVEIAKRLEQAYRMWFDFELQSETKKLKDQTTPVKCVICETSRKPIETHWSEKKPDTGICDICYYGDSLVNYMDDYDQPSDPPQALAAKP